MTNLFDPNTFLDDSSGGALSTQRLLIPAGIPFIGTIVKLNPREGIAKESGKPWAKMEFHFEIDDPEAKEATKKDRVVAIYPVMLNLTEDGRLDTSEGQNTKLGKLKAALGINEGKTAWKDFLYKQAQVVISHRDDNQGGLIDEVKSVASAS